MDADTDTIPRADILDHTQKFNQLIAMRGAAIGVCDLDTSTLVPIVRLPARVATLAGITAQQATDLAAVSTFMGTVLNDTTGAAVYTTLGAAQSLAASGYQKLPSGLIIQWGTATTNGSGQASVTFPLAFPTRAASATANVGSSSVTNCVLATSATTTTLTLSAAFGENSAPFVSASVNWTAVGY
jgi:hypothetical protein